MNTHVSSAKSRSRHQTRWAWWLTVAMVAAVIAAGLAGCSTLGYYSHLAVGEARVLLQRQPVQQVIDNPDTRPQLRQRLQLALQARQFASQVLKLPDNPSYTLYADIGRPFVMYNVFATPALSLDPVQHCFPIAGCVAYQGFYKLKRAHRAADQLKAQGNDVYLGGVPAYSTLGWFDDPILSSMNRWSTDQLIGTIFHELAHQQVYVEGDTAFNESFASFVQREGLRQWHAARHQPASDPGQAKRRDQFTQLVLATRHQLETLYASNLPDAEKLQRKQAAFADLRQQYQALRKNQWDGHDDYAQWIAAPLNNAKLLPFGLYDQYVPAFARLFRQCHGQWTEFYRRVQALGEQKPQQRKVFLKQLINSPAHPSIPQGERSDT